MVCLQVVVMSLACLNCMLAIAMLSICLLLMNNEVGKYQDKEVGYMQMCVMYMSVVSSGTLSSLFSSLPLRSQSSVCAYLVF